MNEHIVNSFTDKPRETWWNQRLAQALAVVFPGKIGCGWITVDQGQRVLPDISIGFEKGKGWVALIESKTDVGVHAMLQALGQCVFYKGHCKQVMLLVPDCMRWRIPVELDLLFERDHGIWIVTERDLERTVAELLEAHSLAPAEA